MKPRHCLSVALLTAATLIPFMGAGRSAAGEAAGKSCADCSKLPCIEAQLWEARYRRYVYQRMSKIRKLTEAAYLRREGELKEVSQAMRTIYVGNNPACNWYVPTEQMEARSLGREYGFNTTWDSGQVTSITFDLVVDPEKCELTKPAARDLMPKVNACTGMGEAIVAHEDRHIADCLTRKKAHLQPLTPAGNAGSEVKGYDAEIEKLEQIRREAAASCMDKSAAGTKPAFDRTARLLGTDIRRLLGIKKTKPATKSPLQRAKGGR